MVITATPALSTCLPPLNVISADSDNHGFPREFHDTIKKHVGYAVKQCAFVEEIHSLEPSLHEDAPFDRHP